MLCVFTLIVTSYVAIARLFDANVIVVDDVIVQPAEQVAEAFLACSGREGIVDNAADDLILIGLFQTAEHVTEAFLACSG